MIFYYKFLMNINIFFNFMIFESPLLFFNNIIKSINYSLTRILFALLIFFIGFVIGKVLGKAVYKILNDFDLNKKLSNKNIKLNGEHLLSTLVSYFIYILTILYSLEVLNIANILLYFFTLLFIFLILLSFFIALLDFFPNFIAGLYLYSREKLDLNKKIKIDDIEGKLIKKELFHIVIETKKGDIIYIPNSSALKSKILIK